MKNKQMTFMAIAIITLALVFTGCPETEDPNAPKQQTATRELEHGVGTVTITGYLTNVEWEGVADTIASRINVSYDETLAEWGEEAVAIYREIFARGITYIVETNPEGYENFKTIGDGKTVYIPLDKVDTEYVVDVLNAIYANETYTSKATIPVSNLKGGLT